jgi:predicted secreted protein
MTAPMAIAVFFTIWWVALFAVLPFGVKSQHEAGGDAPMIGDPGAPVAPRLAIKALWTTGIALVLTGALQMWMTWAG